MHISNSNKPYGSIAISSTQDKTISTDGLYQCAAVAIVDKTKKIQTLLHCCPYENAKINRGILNYIFSDSKDSNFDITIVPGRDEETNETISFLVNNIKDILGKDCEIKFADIIREQSTIVLHKGELYCTEKKPRSRDLAKRCKVNPKDKIIYA